MSNRFAAALGKTGAPEETPAKGRPPPRQKRGKHVGGYFTPEVSRQLRQLALDENSSLQAVLGEALDMLFESRRLPTIARTPGG